MRNKRSTTRADRPSGVSPFRHERGDGTSLTELRALRATGPRESSPTSALPGHVIEELVDILASAVLADMTGESAVPLGTPNGKGPTRENHKV
jgi:hypothetical protein